MKECIYFQIIAHLTNEQVVAVEVIIFELVYKIWWCDAPLCQESPRRQPLLTTEIRRNTNNTRVN